MGSRHEDPPPAAAAPTATTFVHGLHVVLKNLAIYPPAHPRVATAAAAFVTTLHDRSVNAGRIVLQAKGEQVLVDGEPADDACRLPERLRDASLRGVAFAPDCTQDDVLTFASALNRSRARTGTTFASIWTQANPRIEPLPLVFAGVHSATDSPQEWTYEDAGSRVATDAASARRRDLPGLQGVVVRLADSETIQGHLRSIELNACDPESTEEREIDLLTAIATLLPADVSKDPDEIASAVTQILVRVESSLAELVRKNARVKGAELLRVALDIARKYFHTDTPSHLPKAELPSGRPEDARIVADLPLLQQEVAELPDGRTVCLPRAEDLAEDSHTVARRMCGIVLHSLANSPNPAIVAAAVPRLQKTVPRVLCELLDRYLGARDAGSALPTAGSVRILETLLEAGHMDLIRKQRYIDAGFLGRGFPDTLAIAAKVLAGDATGRTTLRDGLATLGPVLEMGGAVAAARTGVLYQPNVTSALVRIGGDIANLLLQQAVTSASPGERQALFECARTLSLPAAEVAALRSVDHVDLLPRDYLPMLFAAATRNDFSGPLRAASGALLRRAVQTGAERRTHDEMLLAIQTLALVPGQQTENLLQELCARGRFTRLGPKSRAVRRCARSTLATILGKAPA
ncbi:MAG: hypothetical protein JNM25_05110 [Planctomycetes bacterium]|nr:hypothetical protein [Planctomycetota bacterium]